MTGTSVRLASRSLTSLWLALMKQKGPSVWLYVSLGSIASNGTITTRSGALGTQDHVPLFPHPFPLIASSFVSGHHLLGLSESASLSTRRHTAKVARAFVFFENTTRGQGLQNAREFQALWDALE